MRLMARAVAVQIRQSIRLASRLKHFVFQITAVSIRLTGRRNGIGQAGRYQDKQIIFS